MKRTLWRAIIVVSLLANFLMVMPAAARVPPPDEQVVASSPEAAPVVAKPSPVAIGSVELQWPHLRAPREEIALSILTQEGVISRGSTPTEIQAALGKYYAKFYAHGEDWVDPQVEQFILQREKELANPSATALAITPVTATVFAMAVQFGADRSAHGGDVHHASSGHYRPDAGRYALPCGDRQQHTLVLAHADGRSQFLPEVGLWLRRASGVRATT